MRRILVSILIAVIVVLAGGGAYVWLSLTGAFTDKRTPARLLALLEPDIVIVKPDGDGPFPAVLLFHGCEGLWNGDKRRPLMGIYADIAKSEGVVAIIVDSLKPRNINSEEAYADVCPGWVLRGSERAGDVAVTVPFARGLPYVDPDRIAIAGWSHGGWTVMDFLAMPPQEMVPYSLTRWPEAAFAGLTAVYLTYPYCGFPALAPGTGEVEPRPTWAIHGTADVTADPAPCDEAYALAIEEGAPVDVEILDGATHAFDRPDVLPDSTSVYDPAFAQIAYDRFRSFLREVLIPSGR